MGEVVKVPGGHGKEQQHPEVGIKVKITGGTSCSTHLEARLYITVGVRVCLAMGHDKFWLA